MYIKHVTRTKEMSLPPRHLQVWATSWSDFIDLLQNYYYPNFIVLQNVIIFSAGAKNNHKKKNKINKYVTRNANFIVSQTKVVFEFISMTITIFFQEMKNSGSRNVCNYSSSNV